MASTESLESCSPLPAEASSARRARRIVHETLASWGLEALEEVASLLASELVSNVVLHVRSDCSLQMGFDGWRLRVGVWDGSLVAPVRHHRSASAATGRGLALVEALASDWGWEPSEQGGKVVWFELEPGSPKTFDRSHPRAER